MGVSAENINIKVFMYHRIVPNDTDVIRDWHSVSEQNFKKQLRLLDTFDFTAITFEDYHLYLQGKLTLPKKPVILTFDDGHLETYEVAVPILKEFDMRAVIYVIGNRNLKYAFWDQRDGTHVLPLMSEDQILDIYSDGFEIGAQTMSHPELPNLTKEEQVEEITGSKQSLEALLRKEILSFAYPYGCLSQECRSIVQEAGFKFACGVYTGPPKFGTDLYNIRRLTIGNNTGIVSYLARLLTPYEYAEWISYKLRHEREDFWKPVSERLIITQLINRS